MSQPKRFLVVSEETNISHDAFATREEAERRAKEMSERHQRRYIVRERAAPTTDCLGRPIRNDMPDPPRRQLLTDDEITTIANEVRTRPLAEVGRHVMPLIQHIVGTEAKTCQNCRFWVTYDRVNDEATVGECTYVRCPDSKARLRAAGKGREKVDKLIDAGRAALMTPFDWQCKAWAQQQQADDAQSCAG